MGNQHGSVYNLSHDGEVLAHYSLPDGVKCLVADDFWIYAGCDDGRVYDLSSKVRGLRDSGRGGHLLAGHSRGVLNVSDRNGGLTVIDHEDELQWSRNSSGQRVDGAGRRPRRVPRAQPRCDGVRGGRRRPALAHRDQRQCALRVAGGERRLRRDRGGGSSSGSPSPTGGSRPPTRCDAAVYSCATSPGGRYVFAGDSASSVYCFTADGSRLWKLGTGGGSALSMQYHDERLYIVSTDGSLACVDASEAAINAAQSGTVPVAADIKPAAALPTYAPLTTAASVATVSAVPAPGSGVVVECTQEGGRVRVHVVSEGDEPSWNVQFPRAIRQPGARYVVDALHSSAGGSTRVRGEIRRLV